MNRSPLISVITVARNAAATIGATVDSVVSQDWEDYEYIVMDGASTDGTLGIVDSRRDMRTRVFSSPDKGIYDAMNKALEKACGRYVIFLNAGDSFADNAALGNFARAALADNADIVYGQTVLVDNDRNVVAPRHLTAPEVLTADSFKRGMMVCHQAFMVKKDIAPQYNTDYRYSADYQWCITCLRQSTKNIYLGETPVIHYLMEGETTRHFKASLRERFRIMCREFGTVPTVLRHIGFAFRYLLRRHKAANKQ